MFPTTEFGKTPHPDVRSWADAATDDPAEIRTRGWPEGANVAIACKPSGLLIVDPDRHECDGVAAFSELAARAHHQQYRCNREYCPGHWPDTYTVQTPTGGLHFYFLNPDPSRFGNGRGALPAGIDVRGGGRGDGGYVLAAGSVLDRRAYEGKPELQAIVGDGKAYRVYNAAEVIEPPGWLLEMLHQKPRRKRTSAEACHALLREWPSVTQARLNAELSRIAQTSPGALRPGRDESKGGRNNQLHESACRFGEAVAVGRVDEETARVELMEAARECGLADDDGAYRVMATIDSGLAKGAADLAGGK